MRQGCTKNRDAHICTGRVITLTPPLDRGHIANVTFEICHSSWVIHSLRSSQPDVHQYPVICEYQFDMDDVSRRRIDVVARRKLWQISGLNFHLTYCKRLKIAIKEL